MKHFSGRTMVARRWGQLKKITRHVPVNIWLTAGIVLLIGIAAVFGNSLRNGRYQLSNAELGLLSQTGIDAKDLKETPLSFTYNLEEDQEGEKLKQVVAAASSSDSTPDIPYTATLPKDSSQGIVFGETKSELSFTMTPEQPFLKGRIEQGRVIYPSATGKKSVYTFKRNGIKEDIILDKAPEKVVHYTWKLGLSSKLEARELPDGGVGIFAANPSLYGDIQISDEKSQKLIDNARTQGKKEFLIFTLPAPYIIDINGRKNTEDVSYSLKGDVLTLEARNLYNKAYPISIDPTVVVTTTAEFQTGSDDGMIDYATSNQITRAAISTGGTGTWTLEATNYFQFPRSGHASVAYNGYLYVIAGQRLLSGGDTSCKDNGLSTKYCSDIQYAVINSNGSLGAWTTNANYLATDRTTTAAVAYNGYLYITGGLIDTAGTACKDSGSSTRCNDTVIGQINSNGSVGALTTSSNYFSTPRNNHASFAYNGYLYILAGNIATGTACKDTGSSTVCNDVQYAPINADGTIGAWTVNGEYFATPRYDTAVAAYNGYLYVTGGQIQTTTTDCKDSGTSLYCNDIQYAVINANGSIGSFTTSANYINLPRSGHTTIATKGYLYVIGGEKEVSDTACKASGTTADCSDTQYFPIFGNGAIGAVTTNANYFTTSRSDHATVAYNNRIYVVGGILGTSAATCKDSGTSLYCNDTQYASINTGTPTFGDTNAYTTNTNYFVEPRTASGSVAVNGYLYVVGGQVDTATTACKDSGSSTDCNDIQYAPINANGSVGTWTTNATYFATPRNALAVAAYNGYLYVVGGGFLNDIQYAPFNSDGSVGTWTTNATSFTTGRISHSAVIYNGYLYVVGGQISSSSTACKDTGTSTVCNDIQYAAINSDGSVGSFTLNSNYFLFPRSAQATFGYNGYLYVVGGSLSAASTNCKLAGSLTVCSDIQYAVINGNGSIGTFTTNATYLTTARSRHLGIAQNGYLFVAGGFQSTNDTNCKDTGVTSRYCNDGEYGAINSNGSVGTITVGANFFIEARQVGSAVGYNGYLYIVGGFTPAAGTTCKNGGSTQYCNDIQYTSPIALAQRATYEKSFDVGDSGTNVRMNSLTFNGQAVCGANMSYRVAGSDGIFGAATSLPAAAAGGTATINVLNKRYLLVKYVLTDETCGTQSNITDITLNWQYDPPEAPTLNAPVDGAVSQSLTPQFQMRSPQANNSYLRYKIEVCSTSNCSSVVRTIDQTSSQTGWTGQDQQTSTAYTGNIAIASSTMATHNYQTPNLSLETQYWWRAYAIDPAKSNTFSAASAIYTFSTNFRPTAPTLNSPANNSSGVSITPDLRIAATDQDGDYLRYKIDICSTSNCSVIVRTIDQTSSQTGWQSQSTQGGTAYLSGQEASHIYQPTALTLSTQYWWRAYAIDPGGVNLFSTASSIQTFTTSTTSTANVILRGGTNIKGGTSF